MTEPIKENLLSLQKRIDRACERSGRLPSEVTLVAVTKTVDTATVIAAYDCGLRNFGENRIQGAKTKIEALDFLRKTITWHMIGHVQGNKTKLAVNLFDIIHSVDSARLAHTLSRQAQKPLPVLIQVNVSGEETRQGIICEDLNIAVKDISRLPNIEIKGLMTMAPVSDDPEAARPVFSALRQLRDSLGLEHLSMGMTDDFEVAIEEGATIVRIGRAIFSQRRLKCV
jgi:pyridoxal phosphate enzyme (YggS family)